MNTPKRIKFTDEDRKVAFRNIEEVRKRHESVRNLRRKRNKQ